MGKKKNKQLKKQLQGSIPAGMTVEELLASAAGGKKKQGATRCDTKQYQ